MRHRLVTQGSHTTHRQTDNERHRDRHYGVLRGDFVKNVGYDQQDILARTGALIPEKSDGWMAEFEIGWATMARAGAWSVFGGYRSLERDAVLDAFTDSDFHLGGTDTEGWFTGFKLAVARNAWLSARWLTADEIDGAPLAIDVLQVDVNAKF